MTIKQGGFFQDFNDPQGNHLASINRDGTFDVVAVNFPDGTQQTTASPPGATGAAGPGVPTATAAGQVPVSTAAGINYAAQNKPVIDVRDVAGIDCTGVTDSSAALNALTDGTNGAVDGAVISFRGCPTVRLNHTWVIKNFTRAPEIDLGRKGYSFQSTLIKSCNVDSAPTGLSYVPAILFSRTGLPEMHGGSIRSHGSGCSSTSTAAVGVENDPVSNPGGVTTTQGNFYEIEFRDGGSTANWRGLVIGGSSVSNQNLEGMQIANNNFNGDATNGSIGVLVNSRTSDHGLILQNNFANINTAVYMLGPWWTFMANVYGSVADHTLYVTPTACIVADANNLTFVNEEPSEGTGQFLSEVTGNNGLGEIQFIGGSLGGDSGGLAPGTSNINVGDGGGDWHFIGVRGRNINGDPIISVGTNGQPKIHCLGNNWIGTFANIDTTKATTYDGIGDSSVGARINTAKGLTLQTVLGGNFNSGAKSPALNFEHTGQVSHAVTNYAWVNAGADGGATSALQIVQTKGTGGLFVMSTPMAGGIVTQAANARTIGSVTTVGTAGSTPYGYKIAAYANNGLVFLYPEVQVATGNATLDSSNYNHIDIHTSGEYWKYCIYRTTGGATQGLLSTAGPNGNGCIVVATDAGQNPPTWGGGGDQHFHFYDQGFVADGSTPPATTADGSVEIPATASFKIGTIGWFAGTGSPEGAVTAPVGSLYSRTNGGTLTTLYVKESGTGNTGWAAK